ncbi:MAG: endonuclease/exonuclease/phosphatase family protein [Cognatishimia activa]
MHFTLASFNVKNLIGADQEYYRFQSYTPEEHAWKVDWMADQILSMDADIIGLQEIFEEDALRHVIEETNERGAALNAAVIPSRDKRYHRKAIFKKLGFDPYDTRYIAFAKNVNDTGEPGHRRPGVAVLSRFGFVGDPEVIQDLPEPLDIPMQDLTGVDGGSIRITRLSRPILKVRVPVGDHVVTLFNCHLKSKLGEFPRPDHGGPAPEADLTQYDPIGRALGSLRAAVRRMAEAWVLRREIVKELEAGNPVAVTGDFNDGENAVSSEIISGETPFKNYAWMLRHDAETPRDRYSEAEDHQIRAALLKMQLVSAENLFLRKSLRDVVYTTAFGGVHESIDQIYLSRHFNPDNPNRIGDMEYFSVFNDHLTDGSHPEAPYNKLASDHGQIMAHMRLK